jgi:hypothetical protein
MKLTINKKLGLLIVAMVVTAFLFVAFTYRVQIARAINFRYQPNTNIATTTPYQTFAKASAGSFATTTVATDGIEQLTLLVMVGSSTTPPVLSYRVQFSSDGVDWYDEDIITTSLATTTYHVSTGAVHTWVYASTTANQTIVNGSNNVKFITKKIVIPNMDTTYTRIVWLNGAGGDVLLNVRPSLKNEYVFLK